MLDSILYRQLSTSPQSPPSKIQNVISLDTFFHVSLSRFINFEHVSLRMFGGIKFIYLLSIYLPFVAMG